LLAIWRAAAANRCMRCVRSNRGVGFYDCCAADREQAHSHIDRGLARNLRMAIQSSWSTANSSDAAQTVGARLPAIWREAAVNRCMRCVRHNRGVGFYDCCAADREQAHSHMGTRVMEQRVLMTATPPTSISSLSRCNQCISVNASFKPSATNTPPIARSNQCPIRAKPARTRGWLNRRATRQNHAPVANAK
jgi:hypothetical protein